MASSLTTVISSSTTTTRPHIVLFPFTTMGHTIPLIHLAHLLFKRGVAIAIFTTPVNSSFVHKSLGHTTATIIELPDHDATPQVLTTAQSTDKLQSMSSLVSSINGTKGLQRHFEKALQTLPTVGCIISDAFLKWTLQSAAKFGIPRLSFYGMSNYTITIYQCLRRFGLHPDDDPFSLPCFPSIKFTKSDLGTLFRAMEDGDWKLEFMNEMDNCTLASHGLIVNSFYEIETAYADYWNSEIGPRAWYVGPLCMTQHQAQALNKPVLLQWLDDRVAMARLVLYVSFGTQAEVPLVQLQEIAVGLERSGVDFLWVLRWKEAELGDGFEERVIERGLVVRDWVKQLEILQHKRVSGFMSHCGWNSVLESICAKVPILAWPMIAEQHMNAKMVEDELGIGLRMPVETSEYAPLVGSEIVEKMVKKLMVGEEGKVARDKAKVVGEAAAKAVEEGGSSYHTIDLLIDEYCRKK